MDTKEEFIKMVGLQKHQTFIRNNYSIQESTTNSNVLTQIQNQYMKSFIAKRVIPILVNFRYLRFKLMKYKENNKKMCDTFDHNFIPLCTMS